MKKALLIGINDYPSNGLSGCLNDVSSVAAVLEKNEDGSPNFSVRCITSPPSKVTKGDIKGEIQQLFFGEGEAALLYFSGHGLFDNNSGYIVTPDFEENDYGVPMEYILGLANKSKYKNKIIILDCCNSGAFGSLAALETASALLNEGVTVLAASRTQESAVEQNGRGLFTEYFVDALEGGACDLRGSITPGSVYAYIDQTLGPWEQRPIFKTNVSTFFALREVTAPINQAVLRKITKYFTTPDSEFLLNPSFEFTSGNSVKANVEIFKELQQFVRVRLVKPTDEDHMYFAAMNSKSCHLTSLGKHYWRLVDKRRV